MVLEEECGICLLVWKGVLVFFFGIEHRLGLLLPYSLESTSALPFLATTSLQVMVDDGTIETTLILSASDVNDTS